MSAQPIAADKSSGMNGSIGRNSKFRPYPYPAAATTTAPRPKSGNRRRISAVLIQRLVFKGRVNLTRRTVLAAVPPLSFAEAKPGWFMAANTLAGMKEEGVVVGDK